MSTLPRRLTAKADKLIGSGKLQYLVIKTNWLVEADTGDDANYIQSIYSKHVSGKESYQRLYQFGVDSPDQLDHLLTLVDV